MLDHLKDNAAALRQFFEQSFAPQPVRLRFNRNHVTYLSAVVRKSVLHISVHRAFLEADLKIWKSLVSFCRRPNQKIRFELESFIEGLSKEVWDSHTRPIKGFGTVMGQIYDLNEVMLRAIKLGFGGHFPQPLPRISWGRRSCPVRSLRLGSYDSSRHWIRVNPVLDDFEVPFNFVVSVVFHELLHALYPPQVNDRKQRIVHTSEFVKAEKQFLLYHWSHNWEKENIEKLIRRGRRLYRQHKRKAS